MRTILILLAFCSLTACAPIGTSPEDPSIGLALGSGGAGGLAHIAMLEVFDDLDIQPARIAGTSIGAVIGALYSAGLSAEEIRAIFADFEGSNTEALTELLKPGAGLSLTDLLTFDLDNGGLISSSGFLEYLKEKVEARQFDDLAIPLAVVATDYWTGDTVVLEEGDLFEAIAASMAVPGLFSPSKRGDQLLIDGGTSNPLPYNLLHGEYDLVVAIDVSGTRSPQDKEDVKLTELLFSTFEVMQQSIISARLEVSEPDIYIKPDTSDVRLLHFNRLESILEKAAPAAEELRKQLAEHIDTED